MKKLRVLAEARREFVEAALQSMTVRRYLLHQFPYKVLTVNLAEQIIVIAFAHTKRKPGYWLERVQ